MKLKSTTQISAPYSINEIVGQKAQVMFIDLASETREEETHEEETIIEYVYDAYEIELMNNEAYIEANYSSLLELAKSAEYARVAEEVRAKRQALLEATDNYAMSDRVMSDEMKAYRQALRDVPEQEGFPYNIEWPIKPEK